MVNKTEQTVELTAEMFNRIYTDEKFRNEVAFALYARDSQGNFKYWETCSYPVRYKVTNRQMQAAKKERERAKKATIRKNKGKLILRGMGMVYSENYPDDIGNYRVRGYFRNPKGNLFLIEFIRGTEKKDFFISHAVDVTKARELNQDHYQQAEYCNYKNLESIRSGELGDYTCENLLRIVNKYFDCNFPQLIIDNYNLDPEDITSTSPPLK